MDEKNKPENFPEEEQPSALSDMLGALGFKPKAQRPGKQEDIRNKPERESVPDGESPLEQEVKASGWGQRAQPELPLEYTDVESEEISLYEELPVPKKKRRW